MFLLKISFLFGEENYNIKDIKKVMEELFEYHIENKILAPKILKRIFKIYVEEFDFEKRYFLKKELISFLDLDEKKIKKIISNIQKEDFSDFFVLNNSIFKAIKRAQKNRLLIKKNLRDLLEDNNLKKKNSKTNSFFVNNKKELFQRQIEEFKNFYLEHQKIVNIDSEKKMEKLFDLYNRKKNRIENRYLSMKEKGEHFFVLQFLKAFAKSLDIHTSFFTNEEAREIRANLEKEFEGIGVVLTETIEGVMIFDLIKKSPAEDSKQIKKGDIIVFINDKNIEETPFEEVLKIMRERKNGQISLGLKRNEKIFYITLQSRAIEMSCERVSFSFEPFGEGIIGKLVLKAFYENSNGISCSKDIKKAISILKQKGDLQGIILDLRENSGGFLKQAIEVAGIFLKNGIVAISKYSNNEIRYLRNLNGKSYYNGPLIILTSKVSASASEIVAQALQDYGVGIVVGDDRTFGKGTIQYQTVTDKESKYFFKVTVGKYFTPSGRSTQVDGVKSDIVVPSIYSSYRIGEKYLKYSLPSEKVEAVFYDNLKDLEPKLKRIFQINYLPYLQKVVTYWKKMVPILQKNSAYRLENDEEYKDYIEKINSKDKKIDLDFQMKEALRIMKDMIFLDIYSRYRLNEEFSKAK
ncbi:MAG: hypothetical protein AMS24_00015 [Chlamydiae bacterium SM23_39]|nr:MAG: hypothetical protein AMS24_00015 [Chlamydiae bacterium SM23_39]